MNYFADLQSTVANALREDIGDGDLTAELIDSSKLATARVITREAAIVCGKPWVDEVFRQVDERIKVEWSVDDGDAVKADDTLIMLDGPARSLVTAERTALNFLQLLSGTATRTRFYVDLIAATSTELLDTRKTIPGMRLAQKYAVNTAGAKNHRAGLYDAFLIKENHIEAAGSITEAIFKARQINPGIRVEVEVENPTELIEAIAAKPDWMLLDNFTIEGLTNAVQLCEGSDIKLEASGGIETPDDLMQIALTGVDYISLGTLTKHCEAIDLSMRFE